MTNPAPTDAATPVTIVVDRASADLTGPRKETSTDMVSPLKPGMTSYSGRGRPRKTDVGHKTSERKRPSVRLDLLRTSMNMGATTSLWTNSESQAYSQPGYTNQPAEDPDYGKRDAASMQTHFQNAAWSVLEPAIGLGRCENNYVSSHTQATDQCRISIHSGLQHANNHIDINHFSQASSKDNKDDKNAEDDKDAEGDIDWEQPMSSYHICPVCGKHIDLGGQHSCGRPQDDTRSIQRKGNEDAEDAEGDTDCEEPIFRSHICPRCQERIGFRGKHSCCLLQDGRWSIQHKGYDPKALQKQYDEAVARDKQRWDADFQAKSGNRLIADMEAAGITSSINVSGSGNGKRKRGSSPASSTEQRKDPTTRKKRKPSGQTSSPQSQNVQAEAEDEHTRLSRVYDPPMASPFGHRFVLPEPSMGRYNIPTYPYFPQNGATAVSGGGIFVGAYGQTFSYTELSISIDQRLDAEQNRTANQNGTANNVTFNNITANNVPVNNVTANNVPVNNVTANNVMANNVNANYVTANNITANNITVNNGTANNVTANQNVTFINVTANNVTANKVTVNNGTAINVTANQNVTTN